ncbi:vancomycin high temperature exclusion protein [Alistipes sp. ZOR0009]|uniref:SanA/YdcF family protein n=1 Tax=Alistipes sp. ZOR0009 TaxID=1339253 RepID=UPI000648756B|nr:ElyC/SanA/YdcF family protein [Alistipes sp. ZOR0009]
MKIKYLKWIAGIGVILSLILIIYANNKIEKASEKDVFYSVSEIPSNNVGLLLGTSKYLRSGKPNQYFENRITATVQLYKAGKIKNVVISGDHGKKNYNEPQDMKNELVKQGIPQESIYLDYAGFRTYDSVYRIKEIFGQTNFTIISQEFHNKRALYIAKSLNLHASGFNAKDVDAYNGFKTKVREKFARVKMLIDLAISKKPKYLGEKIEIK